MKSSKIASKGISIRIIHVIALICAAAIVALLFFTTRQSSNLVSTLSSETDNYIVRQKAAHDLMEASDYLTENVQRFTLDGDIRYMNQYFEEAEFSQRRDKALQAMIDNNADPSLVQQISEALEESRHLMLDEYRAMKLVIEAKGITKYPDILKTVDLKSDSSGDLTDYELMSPEEKMEAAQSLVMGNEYYAKKEIIRTNLKNALEMLDDQMTSARKKTANDRVQELKISRVLIIVLSILLLGLLVLIAVFCTIPLITAYRCNLKKERLPMIGSREFRKMSESYNEMQDRLCASQDKEE